MEVWTGLGILLAIVALAAPVTPGFQNPFVVIGLWLAVGIYASALLSNNWPKISTVIAAYPWATAFVFGAYAFLAAAGLTHAFVIPKAIASAGSATSDPVPARVSAYEAFAAESPRRIGIFNDAIFRAIKLASLIGDQNRLRGVKDITALDQALRLEVNEYNGPFKEKQADADSRLAAIVARIRMTYRDTEELRGLLDTVSSKFPIAVGDPPADEAEARRWVQITADEWSEKLRATVIRPLDSLEGYLVAHTSDR